MRTGTIPSKTLRERATRPRLHGEPDAVERPMEELLAGVADVVAAHDRYMTAQLERNGVRVCAARRASSTATRIEIVRISGAPLRIEAARIVIATGSRPRAPAHLAIDHEHVLDSDSILSLSWLPRSLLVFGGGVIACEYASIFAALGCRVTQVDRNARPLAFVDAELTDVYVEALRRRGGEFLRRRRRARPALGRRVPGPGAARGRPAHSWPTRRWSRSAGWRTWRNCSSTRGRRADGGRPIEVDATLQTSAAGIYAAGDVIGPPSLASAAMEQGRRAACHALGLPLPTGFAERLPAGIYAIPEISTVGLDEAAARRATAARWSDGRASRKSRAPRFRATSAAC